MILSLKKVFACGESFSKRISLIFISASTDLSTLKFPSSASYATAFERSSYTTPLSDMSDAAPCRLVKKNVPSSTTSLITPLITKSEVLFTASGDSEKAYSILRDNLSPVRRPPFSFA